MPYEPTIWQTGDVITAEKLNKIEQALYELSGGGGDEPPAGYVTVAPKQSVTLTGSETDFVQLTTVDGYVLPEYTPEDWIAIIDGNVAEYNSTSACLTFSVDTTYYNVFSLDGVLGFEVYDNVTDETVPGTYEVAVYAPEDSGGGDIG